MNKYIHIIWTTLVGAITIIFVIGVLLFIIWASNEWADVLGPIAVIGIFGGFFLFISYRIGQLVLENE